MTVSTPLSRAETEQDRDLEQRVADLEALIEEARRRARRRRRRRGAAAILVTAASVALLIGIGAGGSRPGTRASSPVPTQAGPPAGGGIVVVSMHGYVRVARTLRSSGRPVRYRLAGRFRITWRIPASALERGHTFRSTSAVVTGTTRAIDTGALSRSCHGTLTAGRKPLLLRIISPGSTGTTNIGMIASPNPIETATSAGCPTSLRVVHWTGSPTGAWIDVIPPRRVPTTDWWQFNHVGLGFYPDLSPLPKGGNSEGWIDQPVPGGHLTWLAVGQLHKVTRAAHKRP